MPRRVAALGLTIQKTQSSDGLSETETAVFERD